MEMVETLCFQIEGEWVTNLARTWFWDENKDYEVVEELLLNCLCTDEITLEEKKDIVRDIIEGRKKLMGLNTFTLEDDGVLVRPIYKKIQELKRKEEIRKIEDDMDIHANNYIDEYALDISLDDYHTECDMDVYYCSYDAVFEYFYKPSDTSETKCGLWILDKPGLVYDLVGGVVDSNNKDEFFQKLYDYLKERENLSSSMKKRQLRYEQTLRVGDVQDAETAKSSLPMYVESDYLFGDPELNYYGRPDDFIKDYAWINRYGEWFSCDFGGHQLKAEVIVCLNEKIEKDFLSWIEEVGEKEEVSIGSAKKIKYTSTKVKMLNSSWYVDGNELYTEYLLRKGWIKFHNPHGGESYPEYYLKPTREQNDAMFKASLKFGYRKIRGLEVED